MKATYFVTITLSVLALAACATPKSASEPTAQAAAQPASQPAAQPEAKVEPDCPKGAEDEVPKCIDACNNGVPGSCEHVGLLFREGKKVRRDLDMALTQYGYACSHKRAGACEQAQKAADEEEPRCREGDGLVCAVLAHAYFNGRGVPQSHEKALALNVLGCDAGHPRACRQLSETYRGGYGMAQDIAKADELLQKTLEVGGAACAADNRPLCLEHVQHLLNTPGMRPNPGVAERLLRELCDGGSHDACIMLGGALTAGHFGVKNPAGALPLLQAACEADFARGCLGAGAVSATMAKDKSAMAEVRRYYAEACRLGSEQGCGFLARTAAIQQEETE